MGTKHATVVDSGGKDFRWISDMMTLRGDEMKHASARNHFLRAMLRFTNALCPDVDEQRAGEISRSASFQDAVCVLLHDALVDEALKR